MSNVLITTLGKARPQDPRQKGPGRYQQARYQFEDNYISKSTSFFGVALKEYLEDTGTHIDKMCILGTSSSMWDAWLEIDDHLYFDNEKLADALIENEQKGGVTELELQELDKVLSGHLKIQVEGLLIPYGMNEEEQLEVLQTISKCANVDDNVYMDVTHGLRHLPILELQSALLMRSRFMTRGLYYGAFERRIELVVPVVVLSGAMKINDWCCAMATLKETGNVAPLARLPGMEKFRNDLLKCQFYEQMNDVSQSRRYAKAIVNHLEELPPEGRLFEVEIRRVFRWGNEQRYAHRQFEQAKKALENGDYLRSVILLMESVISAHMQGNCTNAEEREFVQEELNKKYGDEWHCIRKLRNSFAHGGAPRGRGAAQVIDMRKSEENFKKGIKPLIKWVESVLS